MTVNPPGAAGAETAGISLYAKRVCLFLAGPLYVKIRIAVCALIALAI